MNYQCTQCLGMFEEADAECGCILEEGSCVCYDCYTDPLYQFTGETINAVFRHRWEDEQREGKISNAQIAFRKVLG